MYIYSLEHSYRKEKWASRINVGKRRSTLAGSTQPITLLQGQNLKEFFNLEIMGTTKGTVNSKWLKLQCTSWGQRIFLYIYIYIQKHILVSKNYRVGFSACLQFPFTKRLPGRILRPAWGTAPLAEHSGFASSLCLPILSDVPGASVPTQPFWNHYVYILTIIFYILMRVLHKSMISLHHYWLSAFDHKHLCLPKELNTRMKL